MERRVFFYAPLSLYGIYFNRYGACGASRGCQSAAWLGDSSPEIMWRPGKMEDYSAKMTTTIPHFQGFWAVKCNQQPFFKMASDPHRSTKQQKSAHTYSSAMATILIWCKINTWLTESNERLLTNQPPSLLYCSFTSNDDLLQYSSTICFEAMAVMFLFGNTAQINGNWHRDVTQYICD